MPTVFPIEWGCQVYAETLQYSPIAWQAIFVVPVTYQQIHCHLEPETYTKRRATQHNCRLSLLDDGDKGIEIVNGEEKYIFYWAE